MNSTPLDALLTKLCSGDDEAASQVFKQYEPYLRKVVRRLLPERLRSKFDSVDIVQSVWTDVLQGFREAGYRFANANQLARFWSRRLETVSSTAFVSRTSGRRERKMSGRWLWSKSPLQSNLRPAPT